MPKGELFIRTKRTIAQGSGTGIISTSASDKPSWVQDSGWVDAYERYGMSLEDGQIDKLMTPAPKKQPTGVSQAGVHGVAYSGDSIGITDERTLSVDFHILASTKAIYLQRYALLCNEVFDCGYIQLRVDGLDKYFHLIYQDCPQFEQWNMEMAIYTLVILEPHPEITDRRTPSIML